MNILTDILRCVLHKSSSVFIHQNSSIRSFWRALEWCSHWTIQPWCRGFEDLAEVPAGGAACGGDDGYLQVTYCGIL